MAADTINDYFAAHRRRRAELARDRSAVMDVLQAGVERANVIAETTLDEVRSAMGMHYTLM
ncbi:hypothetical protein [Curtobacterium sp. MCBD17_021]|uniref:hypothetical protein n=1 Tax=Curtobacterium sp. MCBD17_021 TaxID=2175665 RepID=UPI0015E8B5D3|nr:hypothetical protein [Curtobacterium sp. MCBD17_021]